MPQEYKDATYSNNTGLNGQVAPTYYAADGVNNIIATTAVAASQISTQQNLGPGLVAADSGASIPNTAALTTVSYKQSEAGLTAPGNGPVRS
jgi:hypothetical protein